MAKIIEIKNLTKKYGDSHTKVTALNDITLDLEEGESMAIVGPSGSGKTTLLQILGGLDNKTDGTVKINGKDISKFGDSEISKFRNSTIGFVFQFFYLQEYLNALDNVALPLILKGESEKKAKEKAQVLLSKVGMSERAKHYPSEISGGEMQRIAIARALANDPKIILADEPTGNLDAENANKILQLFDEIAASGVSIVCITHDMNVAGKFANVIKLEKGKIVKK